MAKYEGEHASLEIRIWTESHHPQFPRDTGEVSQLLVPHLEHVKQLASQGYVEGEIVDADFRGWWDLHLNKTRKLM